MKALWVERTLACMIFIGITGLGYLYDLRYQYSDLMNARTKTVQLQTDFNVMQQISAHLTEYQSQFNLAQKAFKQAIAVFPKMKDLNAILQMMVSEGEKQGLKFVTIKQSAVITRDFYDEVPVQIAVVGHRQQLLNFLQQWASSGVVFSWGDWTSTKLVGKDQDFFLFKTTATFYCIA